MARERFAHPGVPPASKIDSRIRSPLPGGTFHRHHRVIPDFAPRKTSPHAGTNRMTWLFYRPNRTPAPTNRIIHSRKSSPFELKRRKTAHDSVGCPEKSHLGAAIYPEKPHQSKKTTCLNPISWLFRASRKRSPFVQAAIEAPPGVSTDTAR